MITGVRRSCPSTGCTASPVPNTGEVAEEPSFVDRPPHPPAIQSYHMKYGLDSVLASCPPTSRYSRLNAHAIARSGMMWDHSSKIAFMTFSYGPEQNPVTACGQPALTTVPSSPISAVTAW